MSENMSLSGIKEIAEYCGQIGLPRTYVSIIQLKNQCGFPMRKLLGIWESDKEKIKEWRRQYLDQEEPEPQPARKKGKKI